MKPERIFEIKVGIFVGVAVITFCAIVLLLGGNQFLFSDKYHVDILLNQSQGLDKGSLVSFRGIAIGYVGQVGIDAQSGMIRLRLDLDRDFAGALTTTSVASVKTQGALGDKYIFIKSGEEKGEPLVEGAILKSEANEDFLDLLTSKSSDLESIGELVKELSVLLKNVNANDRSATLMENLALISRNLKTLTGEPSAKATLKHLESVLSKVDQGKGTLGRLINDPTVHERILDLLGESKRNRFLKPLLQESSRSAGNQ